ncbi:MAG: phage tail protein [Bacteroidetes bacterium]|nr:phage tail protein [Bacteroidota bacterium]
MQKTISKFYFLVNIDGKNYAFREADGLEVTGNTCCKNITLKKGTIDRDNIAYTALIDNKTKPTRAITVIIKLTDDIGTSIRSWTLRNAYPIAIKCGKITARSKEIAVESIEFSYSEVSMKRFNAMGR